MLRVDKTAINNRGVHRTHNQKSLLLKMTSIVPKMIAEGKTKQIFAILGDENMVILRSKNSITAFNAQRQNVVDGKGAIATKTTCNVFEYLNALGLQTHFIRRETSAENNGFFALRCKMIPIEWVARRIATGSFLKRNPGVKEGYRFNPPKIEIFYKDDENNDPQWSLEQLIAQEFNFDGRVINKQDVYKMAKCTELVFRVLEMAWAKENCALIDMKIEFGLTTDNSIVIADVIDNDSWRVWPAGDRRLQLDKQFYRDLSNVDDSALLKLKKNYAKVAELTGKFITRGVGRVIVVMGSPTDAECADTICRGVEKFGIRVIKRIASAHKSTSEVLQIIADYEDDGVPTVYIAVAGRSNGLGLVISGNSTHHVINAPPCKADTVAMDIWSSLRTPSGIGCSTVLDAGNAAWAAAEILSDHDHMVRGHILAARFDTTTELMNTDNAIALNSEKDTAI